MLRTILVPLDGSALAERALPYAAGLARTARAKLVLVRATAATPLPGTEPVAAGRAATLGAELELENIADRWRHAGLTVESRAYCDAADVAILAAAREYDADLIVMSTHGRSGLSRWVYGSVAEAVLRAAPVPVLLVPALYAGAWPADRPLRLLVALDGSPLAEGVLGPAGELAAALDAELLLTQVVEQPVPMLTDGAMYVPDWDEAEELVSARQYLEDAAADLRAAGRRVRTQAVAGPPSVVGQAAAVLTATAEKEAVDTIAMATHGRGGLARMMMGSVATGVLHRARVPLLLLGPAAAAQRIAPLRAAEVAGIATPG
jgi:nucleotide-binding universal stress UspA family protein